MRRAASRAIAPRGPPAGTVPGLERAGRIGELRAEESRRAELRERDGERERKKRRRTACDEAGRP